jgi:hypothetical protein
MSKEAIANLEMYSDSACTKEVKDISWLYSEQIPVVEKDGTVRTIDFVKVGDATAEVWIKNPSPYDFTIQQIKCSDPDIQLFLSEATIFPQRPIKLTLKAKGRTLGEPIILIKGFFTKRTVIEK